MMYENKSNDFDFGRQGQHQSSSTGNNINRRDTFFSEMRVMFCSFLICNKLFMSKIY